MALSNLQSLPFKEDVDRWSVEQVAAWHQQREMPEIADIYLRQGIDGHQMLSLPESKLVALFWEFSVRKRAEILNIINQIKSQPTIPHRKSHATRFLNQNLVKCPPSNTNQNIPTGRSGLTGAVINGSVSFGNNGLDLEDVNSLPYADDSLNEDYLVPLSAGTKMVMSPPPPPTRGIKKERCPSPKDKHRIQKELPKPPTALINTSQQQKLSNVALVESAKKFTCYPSAIIADSDDEDEEVEIVENGEELNAYEIINECPDSDLTKSSLFDSKESLIKPPDLPNRNSIPPSISPITSTGNTVAPIVPPRTKSAQLQKPSAFHLQPIRNVSATRTLLTKEPNGISSASTLHQSTPLPQPPNQSSTTSGAKKTISHPILNSSTVTSIQQPLQLINISALASKGNIHSCSSGPGKHSEISSSLPKVRTLDLGGGKSVPMNSLYESLLHENYFHPVIRNALPKLLTKDRMFLVRPSTHSQHPVTLSLQEHDKIFNISIRVRKDGKYSLGTEKPGEMSFISVGEMIGWYEREPIKLVDGSLTYLSWSPPKTLKNIMR